MKFASELGYKTIFWSFAYADWDNGNQPSASVAKEKILSNVHNGEIMLLHPTSATNAEILADIIRELQAYAPDMRACVGWDGNKDPMSMVDRAIALGAYKIQLYTPYFNADTVKRAHEHGILCNVFYADRVELARESLEMGIDCILTNNYLNVYNATKELLEKKK